MTRTPKDPSYRLHKQSGQAVVTLSNGFGGRKDFLLGPYDSEASKEEYKRLVAEWKAAGRRYRQASELAPAPDITINEMMLAYWQHAEAYYVKQGQPTSEQGALRQALRPLKAMYGDTPAKDFSPLSLKAVRDELIAHKVTRQVKVKDPATGKVDVVEKVYANGMARKSINKHVQRIRRMFAWAVAQELVPVTVHDALCRVEGLRKGRSAARDKPRVKPVADTVVDDTLPHLTPLVASMVSVQRLTGMRPREVCLLRPCEIVMGDVWEFRPSIYKTEHLNDDDDADQERVVFIGPKAQAIIKPYLPMSTEEFIFSPRRAEAERNARRRDERKTPLWPSHQRNREKQREDLRACYDGASYRRAIARACEQAGLPKWTPNQLRHTAATKIRRDYGLEASQAVLGHAELGVTQVYAERDMEVARRVMSEVG